MKSRRSAILVGACAGLGLFVVGGFIYYVTAHAWLRHELTAGGVVHAMSPGDTEVIPGRGLVFPNAVTNLPMSDTGGLVEVSFTASRDGVTRYYAAGSPREPQTIDILSRRTSNTYGEAVLEYRVRADIYTYPRDGYMYDLHVTGGGHAGYSAIGTARQLSGSLFALEIVENVHGDILRYEARVCVDSGEVTVIDGVVQ